MALYKKDSSGYAPTEEMVAKFKAECHDRSHLIDPSNEEDWKSLTLGWAVANGMDPDPELGDPDNNAHNFARYMRYHTDLA